MKGTDMFAHATETAPLQIADQLGHFMSRLTAAFAGAQEANRVFTHFSRLSDRQLTARGLTREDINRMSLQALNNAILG